MVGGHCSSESLEDMGREETVIKLLFSFITLRV
jgi:hypothetical protein